MNIRVSFVKYKIDKPAYCGTGLAILESVWETVSEYLSAKFI